MPEPTTPMNASAACRYVALLPPPYQLRVNMLQTGNTIFAALGVSDLPAASPKLAWVKSLTALLCFLFGSVCTATLHRYGGERKRWVLFSSFLVQMVFIAIAAAMVRLGKSSGSPVGGGRLLTIDGIPADPGFPWTDLIPIGLLSFQAAGKVVESRMVQQNALPVVVLTTLYSDLVSDPALFTAGLMGNVQRNRRLGGAVFYFVGAVCGGVAAAHSIGFSGGLAIAGAVQFCVAVSWLAWPAEKSDEDEER